LRTSESYRVLIFTPAFAPFGNAEAIVNSKLALALIESGWDVDIISRNLAKTSSYIYGSSWVEPWLPLRKHTFEISYKVGKKIFRTLDIIRCSIKTKYPIDGCRWAARAYDCALSLLKNKQCDIILSRTFTVYAHLPALMPNL
jgi:hypothetical protein